MPSVPLTFGLLGSDPDALDPRKNHATYGTSYKTTGVDWNAGTPVPRAQKSGLGFGSDVSSIVQQFPVSRIGFDKPGVGTNPTFNPFGLFKLGEPAGGPMSTVLPRVSTVTIDGSASTMGGLRETASQIMSGLQGGGDSIEGLQTASFGGGELDGLLTPTNIAIAAVVAGGLFYWATS